MSIPIGPRGVYDEAKRFAEAITMAYHRYHGLNTRIVRIFNTYGPRMRLQDGRVVPNFIMQALNGEPLTVYGQGSRRAAFNTSTISSPASKSFCKRDHHLPVNIGNPHEMTVLEFAKKIIELTGSKSAIVYKPLPEDDPQVRQPDITKAQQDSRLGAQGETRRRFDQNHRIFSHQACGAKRHENRRYGRRGIYRLATSSMPTSSAATKFTSSTTSRRARRSNLNPKRRFIAVDIADAQKRQS